MVKLRSESGCEMLCFDIILTATKHRVILVYRPPNLHLSKLSQQAQLSAMTQLLNYLSDVKYTTFICGDFNFPAIDWDTLNVKHDGITNVFLNCMSSLGMTQFILEPNRLSTSSSDNILDLLFSNDPYSIRITDISPPIGSIATTMLLNFRLYCHAFRLLWILWTI